MKRKIDLYTIKVRGSTPLKTPPKRKLSLVKQISNNVPLHLLQLTNQ